MSSAERQTVRSDRSLALAERRAHEARERALRAGNAGRPTVGARYARAGLRQLGWKEDGEQPDTLQVHERHRGLAARLLGILAQWESEQGHPEYGLHLLNRAERMAAAEDRGILYLQSGLIFIRTWQESDALRVLDEAIVLLKQNPAEIANLASALINRSFLHLNAGDVRRARADLTWCRQVATDGSHDEHAAKALHNLGYCDLLAGDIPAALQFFNAAARIYRTNAPSFLPVLTMDRARALLAAGLARDAADSLDEAMAAFRQQRLDYDLADAELARAEAALAAGDPAVARRWAMAAERRFRRQGNDALACQAELTRLRAQPVTAGRPANVAAEALRLAGRLRERRLANDASLAELLAARALIAAGRPDEARRLIAAVRRGGQTVPLTLRLPWMVSRFRGVELTSTK